MESLLKFNTPYKTECIQEYTTMQQVAIICAQIVDFAASSHLLLN